MARIRMVKPEFFDDPEVGELSLGARLLFIGIWTQADREGRLSDDHRRLKARIFPYDSVNVEAFLEELHVKDMIRRYADDQGARFIWIKRFEKHQRPHHKENASVIAPCPPCDGKHKTLNPGKVVASPEKVGTSPIQEVPSPPDSGSLILDPGVRSLDAKHTHSTSKSSGGACAGSLPRDHMSHAACDDRMVWCVTSQVQDWLSGLLAPKYGDDRQAAKAALKLWYPTVWAKLPRDYVIGADAFKFWRPHFDAAFVTRNGVPKQDERKNPHTYEETLARKKLEADAFAKVDPVKAAAARTAALAAIKRSGIAPAAK